MYGKIFAQMYEGSMMGAGPWVFAVWPYIISNADQQGYIELNPKLIALKIGGGGTPEDVESALAYLTSPDPYSRSTEEEGRRLVKEGQYLYRIVNYRKYRDLRDIEARREQNRDAAKRYRDKQKAAVTGDDKPPSSPIIIHQQPSAVVSETQPPSAQADRDRDTDRKKEKEGKDLLSEIPVSLRTGEFIRAWKEWEAYRKERKKSLTSKSRMLQLKDLEAWGPEASVTSIEMSIKSGWLGLFPPKQHAQAPAAPQKPMAGAHVGEPKLRKWFDEDAPAWARKIGGDMASGVPVSEEDVAKYSEWMYGG